MTREEKIKLAIEKGYSCDPKTGDIFGPNGNILSKNNIRGQYMRFNIVENKSHYAISSHQFIFYWVNKKCVEMIDHIDGNKLNNSIDNLRESNNSKNQQNRKDVKGYSLHPSGKYISIINIDGKNRHLGYFKNKEEASKAYLDAKKIYHNI